MIILVQETMNQRYEQLLQNMSEKLLPYQNSSYEELGKECAITISPEGTNSPTKGVSDLIT